MRWLPLALVLAAHAADAKPRRGDFEDDYPKPAPVCRRTSNWKAFVACRFKGKHVALVHDLPRAKLVGIELSQSYQPGAKRLELYLLGEGAWVQSGFYAETNATTELVGFSTLAADTYRLDVGYANPTWVTLDEVNTRPALVKRQYAYVCSLAGSCRSVMTGCDVLVHGKAVATFRGEAQWDGGTLKIRGDARNTNRYCTKPPNLIEADT